MLENLAREFRGFHYLPRNRIGSRAGSSSGAQEMTHADAFDFSSPAQTGDLGAGPFPQHAGTPGARHRRFRDRTGADDREQDRQGAVPDAAVSSAPFLVPLNPHPSTKGETYDQ